MGKVAMGLSMSLDGFIAGPNDGPERPLGEGGERLFAWYSGGETKYRLPGTEMVFEISPQSAELLGEAHSKMGAFVTGRRTFDITNGWGGSPPWAYLPLSSPIPSRKNGSTRGRRSRSSRMVSRAPSSKREWPRATRTSPWAPPASCSSASGRGFLTRYT
jgi:dihydrofolate reductase